MNLDLNKLENIRKTSRGFSCGCPVCIENGADSARIHMFMFNNGKFTCVADSSHTKRIFELVGLKDRKSGQNMSLLANEKTEIQTEPLKIPKIYDKSILQRLFPMFDFYLNQGI